MAEKLTASRSFVHDGKVYRRGDALEVSAPDASRLTAGDRPFARREVKATPAAVKLAGEHDIDLGAIEGTGADGGVTVSDVRALVEEMDES
jgi:pyruvate/2-oxoglutarate dehydrogenase complex dihydrolipoamide acyltransferase (E2) component